MRRKRNHGALLCLSGVLAGCIVTSAVCGQRVDELTMERDIYSYRYKNWEQTASEREETIDQLQTELDKLTAELAAHNDLSLTYIGAFSCTAYCAEEPSCRSVWSAFQDQQRSGPENYSCSALADLTAS